jgi:hypothetical protein
MAGAKEKQAVGGLNLVKGGWMRIRIYTVDFLKIDFSNVNRPIRRTAHRGWNLGILRIDCTDSTGHAWDFHLRFRGRGPLIGRYLTPPALGAPSEKEPCSC